MSQPPGNPYPSQPNPGPQYGGGQYGSPQSGQQYGGGQYGGGQYGSPQSNQQYGGGQHGTPQSGQQYGGGQYGSPQSDQYGGGQYGGGQYGSSPADQQYGGGQYGAPQSGPQYGGEPAGALPPKKKSKAKVLLIALAAVLVLCLGGGAIFAFVVKDEVKETVDAANTRLVTPETLGGRAKSTDPNLQKMSADMSTSVKQDVPGATSVIGQFYGDPTKQDMVMVLGASGVFADPKKELDDMVKGLSTELGVKNMATVEAGPLGGEARCGDGVVDGVPLGVCAWADKGSVVGIVMYFKSKEAAQAELVALRGEIQKRG